MKHDPSKKKKGCQYTVVNQYFNLGQGEGVVVAVIVWWLDLQLPMHSVPITTYVVSSNLDQGEVSNIM